MAYIRSRHDGRFWKAYGQGTTDSFAEAYRYSDAQALAIVRVFYVDAEALLWNKQANNWIVHKFEEPKNIPPRSKFMVENDLIWVTYNGGWYAARPQEIIVGMLKATTENKAVVAT